jgi:transcriptional regulator with XRE-family HTH domain
MPQPSPGELIHNYGLRVAELRAAHGLTQAELAERLDVTLRYMQRVEAGQQNVTLGTQARVSQALDVPPWEFLRPATQPDAPTGRPRKGG